MDLLTPYRVTDWGGGERWRNSVRPYWKKTVLGEAEARVTEGRLLVRREEGNHEVWGGGERRDQNWQTVHSCAFLRLRFYFSLLGLSTNYGGGGAKLGKWSEKATEDTAFPPPPFPVFNCFPWWQPYPSSHSQRANTSYKTGQAAREDGRRNSKQTVVLRLLLGRWKPRVGTGAKDQTSRDFPKKSGNLQPESLPFLPLVRLPLPRQFSSPLSSFHHPKMSFL